jgi:hypothetical protein
MTDTAPPAEQSGVQRHRAPAWFIVAVFDEHVALLAQSRTANILAGPSDDDREPGSNDGWDPNIEKPSRGIRPTTDADQVLAILKDPEFAHLFAVVPDDQTRMWMAANALSLSPVLTIDQVESAAEPFTRDYCKPPLSELRRRDARDALEKAVQTGARAFWALGGDVADSKNPEDRRTGLTDRQRAEVLGGVGVSARVLELVKPRKAKKKK